MSDIPKKCDVDAMKLFLFFGEDDFSILEELKRWKKAFIEKYDEMNFLEFDSANSSLHEIVNACSSSPFLSEKKLIFIFDYLKESTAEEQKKMSDFLNKSSLSHLLLVFVERKKPDARTLLFKTLKKNAQIKEFAQRSGALLISWIKAKATAINLNISENEIRYFIDTVGLNSWFLNSELDKLKNYALDKKITIEMIDKVVCANLKSSVFKLTDYLGEKKIKEALSVLHILSNSGEDMMAVFFMLLRHFRLMAAVKNQLQKKLKSSEIAKKTGIHPFVAMKLVSQSVKFTFDDLRLIYDFLLSIDTSVKTGKIRLSTGDFFELTGEIEFLIIKICKG